MLRTTTFTATAERDKGKVFLLTEMSAFAAHEWAMRALHAMVGAGADLSPEIVSAGMAGVASMASDGTATMLMQALGKVPFDTLKSLTDELLTCVAYQPSANVRLSDIERHN